MTDDKEIEELRRTTAKHISTDRVEGRRVDGLRTDIEAALRDIDVGDRSKMIGFRDGSTAALLEVLSEREAGMASLGSSLAETLEREPADEYDRSEIVRLAVRVGLQHAAPEYYRELNEAVIERTRDTL